MPIATSAVELACNKARRLCGIRNRLHPIPSGTLRHNTPPCRSYSIQSKLLLGSTVFRQFTATSHILDLLLHGWQRQILAFDDPGSAFDNMFGRKDAFMNQPLHDGVAYAQFSGGLFLRDPVVLLLERRNLMIAAQPRHTGSIPS